MIYEIDHWRGCKGATVRITPSRPNTESPATERWLGFLCLADLNGSELLNSYNEMTSTQGSSEKNSSKSQGVFPCLRCRHLKARES